MHKIYPFIIVIVSTVVFGFNSLYAPYFEGDEGIYMSRAHAFYTDRQLSTGTYWYDHPPLGWILLSLSLVLPFFDSVLLSGRLLILLLGIINALSVYLIVYRVTNKRIFGLIASLFFIFSPLQVYFGRRILLDNILVFWILLGLATYYWIPKKPLALIASAVCFALAVLTKENAILFVIPMIGLLFYRNGAAKKQALLWVGIFAIVVAMYPIYAASRGELLPNNYFSQGGKPSLISTLVYQANRNKSGILDFDKNPFWPRVKSWIEEDPVLVGLGMFAVMSNLLLGIKRKDRNYIVYPLFVLVQLAFLMRGGVVFEFYILALIPFLAINIALLLNYGYEYLEPSYHKNANLLFMVVPLLLVLITTTIMVKDRSPFVGRQTDAQLRAIKWMHENKRDNLYVITDSFAVPDLRRAGINARSQYDAEYNPTFRNAVEKQEITVNYVLATQQFEWDSNLKFVQSIIDRSRLVQEFTSPGWYVHIYETVN